MYYMDIFEKLEEKEMEEQSNLTNNQSFVEQPPMSWEESLANIRSKTPVLYNVSNNLSPYMEDNWSSSSNFIYNMIANGGFAELIDNNNIDANKFFSSELSSLRTIASDQTKITKLFEKRLMESLTEKGKHGLTEEDVEAMQALTAARSSLASINKEQVAIKKSIADIKIKQNNITGRDGQTEARKSAAPMDIGRSILDNIFNASTPVNNTPMQMNYQSTDINSAEKILDNSATIQVDNRLSYESSSPTTYVVLGDTNDDAEYATYSASGEIIEDYPNPVSNIVTIDRDAGIAVDEYLVQYPIKQK